jgi:23S rRNA (adenine2030-N6)-methyltransferase
MLSYRHAFHAGNHADILKHFVLVHCLGYMGRKEKPFLFVDTHAGAGLYHLEEGYADKNKEWLAGIGALRELPENTIPPATARYCIAVEEIVRTETGSCYPGSPLVAQRFLREQDRAVLFELHPTDFRILEDRLKDDRRIQVRREDGLGALASLLPPPSRRACIFIDPPYELKEDYERVPLMLEQALKRFPQGVYILWHPLLSQSEPQAMADRLLSLYRGNRCAAQIRIREKQPGTHGMYGSGVVVYNPPWMLKQALEENLPFLAQTLGTQHPSWSLQWDDLE